PYCLWYFYLLAALLYLGLTSRRDFVTLQTVLFAGMGICLLVYVVFPNAISFRPAITGGDPLSRAMAAMFSLDSPTMVTPSIHVFNAAAVHVSLVKNRVTGKNKPLIALSFILAVFICASTVFVKQHSVIDVFMGLALCLALCIPVYAAKK
ncbi:MAG: phosphatase PAP2 family protein, partial [Bacillota bacterium]|nr:phosphatase PAP2 family protein [Bacillota bacterium]